MATLQNIEGQQKRTTMFDASGTVAAGGTSQLVLAESLSRCFLQIENISAGNLYFEFGSARATATISGGKVTGCTVTNGGFGFTLAPAIRFLGGGTGGISGGNVVGSGQPMRPAPGWSQPGNEAAAGDHPARARCVLTGGVVTSIVVEDGGQGYIAAPYVWITNSHNDPNGCADPFFNSATSGVLLIPAGSETWESSVCPTDSVAVYGASTGQAFTVKYMP